MNSHLGEEFLDAFRALPKNVQTQARKAHRLWKQNPYHRSLQFKCVHRPENVYSVRIGKDWRALGIRDGDSMYWFWIGSHAEYDKILKQL